MARDITWESAHEPVLVELDDRRRTALGKIGRKEHTRYLVEEEPDGTLIWRPAVVLPEHELRFMRAHPEEYGEIRRRQSDPDRQRRRERPRRARREAGTPREPAPA